MNLLPYRETINDLNILEPRASFNSGHWLNFEYGNDLITTKVNEITENYFERISRQDIIAYLSDHNNSLMTGFIMSMIWGHGYTGNNRPDNRGPWKLARMLSNLGTADGIFQDVYASLSESNIINAHRAFIPMPRCRVAYFSKFLYFLGKALQMINYPLIFDKRVATGIATLGLEDSVLRHTLDVNPNPDAISYNVYVTEIHRNAELLHVDADKIEFFLFSHPLPIN